MSSLNLSPTEENCFSYISFLKTHLWTWDGFFVLRTNLKDGVHDAGQRPMVRVLWNSKDVQTPLVDVLQVLQNAREDIRQLRYKLKKSARFLCNRWSVMLTIPLRASPPNLFSRRSGPYCSCWTDPGRVWPSSPRWSESSAAAASSFCPAILEWAMGSPVHSVYLQGERFQPVIVNFSTHTLNSQQIPWLYTLSEWIQVSKIKFDISKSHLQELFCQVQQFMLQLNIPWCKESLD